MENNYKNKISKIIFYFLIMIQNSFQETFKNVNRERLQQTCQIIGIIYIALLVITCLKLKIAQVRL